MSLELCVADSRIPHSWCTTRQAGSTAAEGGLTSRGQFVLLYCCVSSFIFIPLVWQYASRALLPNMQDLIENKLHDPQDQVFLAHLPFNLTLTLTRTHYH